MTDKENVSTKKSREEGVDTNFSEFRKALKECAEKHYKKSKEPSK